MELAPIPGIRPLPAVEPRGNGLDVPAVFAVQDSPRAGDETYNGKAKASTGGQDDEPEPADESEQDETAEAMADDEGDVGPAPLRGYGPIDFFA
jgi:hypothetical protein